jgi:hypothetical protein
MASQAFTSSSVAPETAMVGVLCLLLAGGICWAIVVPARGVHDRIAGTWLVPR